jgi:hypothetical protein
VTSTRRELIALLASTAAVSWPLSVGAQQSTIAEVHSVASKRGVFVMHVEDTSGHASLQKRYPTPIGRGRDRSCVGP